MKALRVGGIVFIQTHQSFSVYGYPYDYFRFSREPLAGPVGKRMSFRVLATDYEFPVKLLSLCEPGILKAPSFLDVRRFGEKIAATPQTYIFDDDII